MSVPFKCIMAMVASVIIAIASLVLIGGVFWFPDVISPAAAGIYMLLGIGLATFILLQFGTKTSCGPRTNDEFLPSTLVTERV